MNLNGVYAILLLIVPISGTLDEDLGRPAGPPEELTVLLEIEEVEDGGGSFLERHFSGSSGRSPYRLVYDVDCEDYETGKVGKWIKVEKKDCPIVFEDPYFEHHGYVCNRDSGELALDCNTESEAMWSYPEYQECKNVPVCYACPILAQCGATTPPPPQIGAGFVASWLTEAEYYRFEQLQQKHWLSEQDRAELSCLQEKQRGLRPSWTSCIQGSLREFETGGHTSHNIHVNVVQGSSHQPTGTVNRHSSSHDQSGSSRQVLGQSGSFDHFSSGHDGSSRTSQVSGQGSSFDHQGTTPQFGQEGSSHGSNSHFSSGHDSSSHTSRQVLGQGSSFNQQGSSTHFGHDSLSQGAMSGHGSFQHSSRTQSVGQNSGFNHGSSTHFEGQGSSLSHGTRTQVSGQGSTFSHAANSQVLGQNTKLSQGTRVSGHGTAFAHDSNSHSSGQGSFSHQSGTEFSDQGTFTQNSALSGHGIQPSGHGSFSHSTGTQFSGQGSFSQQSRTDSNQGSLSHTSGNQLSGQGAFSQQSRTDLNQGSLSHTSGTQLSGQGLGFSHGTRTQGTGQDFGFSHQQSTNLQAGLTDSFSHSANTEVSSSSWGTPSNNWGIFD